jgi:gas vesicle protein
MNNNFLRGIMAGAIMGAVVGIIFDPIRSNKNKENGSMKNRASRMFKTAGNIIENLSDM